jgi:hypothetical protein
MESITDLAIGTLFVAWISVGVVMGICAAAFLARHDRAGLGLLWGLLFGPLGILLAFLKAENIDREEADKDARDLMRQALANGEQDIARAVAAALASQRAEREPRSLVPDSPKPSSPSEPAPSGAPPRARSYEEIMSSEPPRPARRFR